VVIYEGRNLACVILARSTVGGVSSDWSKGHQDWALKEGEPHCIVVHKL
jgi:hypothetical protein